MIEAPTSPLVPESSLRERYVAIVAATDSARLHLIETDGDAEVALRYFLVFSEPDAVARAGLGSFSDEALFYNRYYWFRRFAKLHRVAHGYDAGIEDQATRLLERAPIGVDWTLVESL